MRRIASSAFISAIFLFNTSEIKSEVFIPAGTSISGIESQGASNGWGIPGVTYSNTNSTWTFTQKTSCDLDGYVIANTTNQAHTALCQKEAGTFLNENSDGTGGIQINGTDLIKSTSDGEVQIGADGNDIDVVADGLNIDGAAVITKNSDGSIQIGGDGNDVDITAEGMNIDGNPVITKKSDGIHIGKNSFVIGDDVVNGAHPIWATDENGNKIPLNIDGSDLQINGVSVQGQIDTNKNNINNLGEGVANATALTAALTSLPQASTESKFSCGVGTGTYSSSYALGLGCASKVNERIDINFGGSYVGGASKDYGSGSLDNVAAKAGFVFKLGKINNPTLISMKEKEGMQSKITELSASNKEIKAANEKIQLQNKELEAKVDSFELEKAALLARLEKIEQIALANQKDEKTAFSFLNLSNLFSSMRSFLISSN